MPSARNSSAQTPSSPSPSSTPANANANERSPQHPMPEPPSKVVEQAAVEEIRLTEPELAGPLSSWLRWSQASMSKLVQAEASLLKKVKAAIVSRYVPVRLWNSSVYTISVRSKAAEEGASNESYEKVPFVLIPGFAAGVGVWAANLDALSEKRTVHAFDILGFGRSSRPEFSNDPTLAELEFVQSIEDWRKVMGIEKMILIGHSFGGFLASSYTLEYPQRVRHLVLVDPWGFPERPNTEQFHIPYWMRTVASFLAMFNPLAALRMAGPYGTRLVKKLRSDLGARYAFDDPDAIYEYVYQCNAQNPTGEMAFVTMTKNYGWARRPMIHRFNGIHPSVPVSFIYGAKTYMDSSPAYQIQSQRLDSYVDIQIVPGAGHHVYVDATDKFNKLIRGISDIVDRNEDQPQFSPAMEQQ